MIIRIWTTGFDPSRRDELDAFANDVSKPMLRRQPGNLGVIFAADGDEWLTITLWEDEPAIAGLDTSADYQDTVAKILAAGFLVGEQVTRTYDDHGVDLAPTVFDNGS